MKKQEKKKNTMSCGLGHTHSHSHSQNYFQKEQPFDGILPSPVLSRLATLLPYETEETETQEETKWIHPLKQHMASCQEYKIAKKVIELEALIKILQLLSKEEKEATDHLVKLKRVYESLDCHSKAALALKHVKILAVVKLQNIRSELALKEAIAHAMRGYIVNGERILKMLQE